MNRAIFYVSEAIFRIKRALNSIKAFRRYHRRPVYHLIDLYFEVRALTRPKNIEYSKKILYQFLDFYQITTYQELMSVTDIKLFTKANTRYESLNRWRAINQFKLWSRNLNHLRSIITYYNRKNRSDKMFLEYTNFKQEMISGD